MYSRTLGTIAVSGALSLVPAAASAIDFEELVPGGYFTESAATDTAADPPGWSLQPFPGVTFSSQASLERLTNRTRRSDASQNYGFSSGNRHAEGAIAFFTPRFSGLQGGIGYRPDSLVADGATEIGLNWNLDFSSGTRISAVGGYEPDRGDYSFGASYAQGPWELQLTYGAKDRETEYEEIESLALSAGYSVGHGISLTGILGAAGRTKTTEENNRVEEFDNDDFWVVTGFSIRF
jgi:predicted porin